MNKISAVYKIVNTVTNDCYVGSSKNAYKRWKNHKCSSFWKKCPNNPMYQDMQKYGVDKFRFQILAPVISEYLTQVEQEFIEILHPIYNSIRANGWDTERHKETKKKWCQTDKGKEIHRRLACKSMKKYYNQLCLYNGETLTLNALCKRFHRAGIKHATLEAKKYLLRK